MDDNFDLEDEGNKFDSSNKLIDAVRKMDYKQQYKACVAFYNEIIKYPRWDNNRFALLFDDLFESLEHSVSMAC